MMLIDVHFILVLLFTAIALSSQEDTDAQYRKDLKQINYYNWLLHRHRTEKQKIEKVNNDIKSARLLKLQQIIDTPAPHNISLIATDANFATIKRLVHPVNNKPVTDSLEELSVLLSPQRRQARQGPNDSTEKPESLVEFQLSEREYAKFAKFLRNKTIRKKTN